MILERRNRTSRPERIGAWRHLSICYATWVLSRKEWLPKQPSVSAPRGLLGAPMLSSIRDTKVETSSGLFGSGKDKSKYVRLMGSPVSLRFWGCMRPGDTLLELTYLLLFL